MKQPIDDMCTVQMDGEVVAAEDFVAVLCGENGEASIYYKTNALTLGLAFKLVGHEFAKCLKGCSQEEQELISNILGDFSIIGGPNGQN